MLEKLELELFDLHYSCAGIIYFQADTPSSLPGITLL